MAKYLIFNTFFLNLTKNISSWSPLFCTIFKLTLQIACVWCVYMRCGWIINTSILKTVIIIYNMRSILSFFYINVHLCMTKYSLLLYNWY